MSEKPNLLWIMTDQQRTDSIRAYGNPFVKTPNMDGLAAGGIRFDRCYISTTPCSPSRASLLTGLYAHTHGVVVNGIVLPDSVPTLGDALKAEGYRTAWIGKWHLGGPQHGFTDKWVDHRGDHRDYLERVGLLQAFTEVRYGLGKKRDRGKVRKHGRSPIPEEHYLETFLAREAIAFLEEAGSQPFCLALSFRAPHPPVTPPEPWDRMYPPDKVPLPANHIIYLKDRPTESGGLGPKVPYTRDGLLKRRKGQPGSGRLADKALRQRLDRWTEEEWRDHAAHYYGYVSYVDKWTGRVLEALDRQGFTKNTIVLFTTDHGDMLGSHGLMGKGPTYDEAARVPLIMRYPPLIKPGTATDALVSNVDILPTLLEMMDVKVPSGVQGRNFLSLLEGEAGSRRDAVFMEKDRSGGDSRAVYRMVRTDRWKYTVSWHPSVREELYDMESDTLELSNLSGDPGQNQVRRGLRRRILEWMGETGDPSREEFARI